MKKALGTHEIAKLCHVTPPAVIRWLDEGKIPCFTTGGGHRRVWEEDLIAFMRKHNMSIPDQLVAAMRLRFLIVDDEPQNRKVIQKILRRLYPTAELVEAADGFEAGHKLGAFLPSLVILDLELPGINGIKVCQMIRSDERLKGIKILAISGYNVEEAKDEVKAAGADDFLGKPFKIAELAQRLQHLLGEGAG